MMGTSLLSMPWALEQAGLVMGLLMMVSINQITAITSFFANQYLRKFSMGSAQCMLIRPTAIQMQQ